MQKPEPLIRVQVNVHPEDRLVVFLDPAHDGVLVQDREAVDARALVQALRHGARKHALHEGAHVLGHGQHLAQVASSALHVARLQRVRVLVLLPGIGKGKLERVDEALEFSRADGQGVVVSRVRRGRNNKNDAGEFGHV